MNCEKLAIARKKNFRLNCNYPFPDWNKNRIESCMRNSQLWEKIPNWDKDRDYLYFYYFVAEKKASRDNVNVNFNSKDELVYLHPWHFLRYEVTSTKYTRDVYKELLISLVASLFMGFGVLFLLLWVGIYVWKWVSVLLLIYNCTFY